MDCDCITENLFVGPCLLGAEEAEELRSLGVTAILSLQDKEEDMRKRGVEWEEKAALNAKLAFRNVPVRDFDGEVLREGLRSRELCRVAAKQQTYQLVRLRTSDSSGGPRVFVCASERAPLLENNFPSENTGLASGVSGSQKIPLVATLDFAQFVRFLWSLAL